MKKILFVVVIFLVVLGMAIIINLTDKGQFSWCPKDTFQCPDSNGYAPLKLERLGAFCQFPKCPMNTK